MMSRRYVFDTNVIISALLFSSSKPAIAFRYALQVGEILVSLNFLEELSEVLGRRKFDAYLTYQEREAFIQAFVESANLIESTTSIQICRDAKDNQILELAVSGKAEAIITGDRDLLVLHPFQQIKIVSVDEFLRQIPGDRTNN